MVAVPTAVKRHLPSLTWSVRDAGPHRQGVHIGFAEEEGSHILSRSCPLSIGHILTSGSAKSIVFQVAKETHPVILVGEVAPLSVGVEVVARVACTECGGEPLETLITLYLDDRARCAGILHPGIGDQGDGLYSLGVQLPDFLHATYLSPIDVVRHAS